MKKLLWPRFGFAFRLRRTDRVAVDCTSDTSALFYWPLNIYHNNPYSSCLEIFLAVNLQSKNWIKDSTADTTKAYLSHEYLSVYSISISLAKSLKKNGERWLFQDVSLLLGFLILEDVRHAQKSFQTLFEKVDYLNQSRKLSFGKW